MSDQEEEMPIEEAVANIVAAIKDFENLEPETQARLRVFLIEIRDNLAQAESRQRELERAKAAGKRDSARERKKLRDELIPKWCEENLKPGMIVKVKANSATKFREIETIKPGSTMANGYKFDGYLTGRHVRYVRRRDLETLEFAHELTRDGYITDHVLRNIQGVVLRSDAAGKPIVTPIMELIEGVNE
jgi:hypothetical protein